MKKIIFLCVALCFALSLSVFAKAQIAQENWSSGKLIPGEKAEGWFPVKLCLWPTLPSFPPTQDIYGLSLGLITYNQNLETKTVGVDLSLFASLVDNVEGLSLSICNLASNGTGVQMSFMQETYNFNGLQLGIVNIERELCGTQKADNTVVQLGIGNSIVHAGTGIQIGLYNKSEEGSGFQVGIMNFMKNGFLPVFPFFNFSVK